MCCSCQTHKKSAASRRAALLKHEMARHAARQAHRNMRGTAAVIAASASSSSSFPPASPSPARTHRNVVVELQPLAGLPQEASSTREMTQPGKSQAASRISPSATVTVASAAAERADRAWLRRPGGPAAVYELASKQKSDPGMAQRWLPMHELLGLHAAAHTHPQQWGAGPRGARAAQHPRGWGWTGGLGWVKGWGWIPQVGWVKGWGWTPQVGWEGWAMGWGWGWGRALPAAGWCTRRSGSSCHKSGRQSRTRPARGVLELAAWQVLHATTGKHVCAASYALSSCLPSEDGTCGQTSRSR